MAYSYPRLQHITLEMLFQKYRSSRFGAFFDDKLSYGEGETVGRWAFEIYDKTLLVVQAVLGPYFEQTKIIGGKRNELLQK